MISFKQLGIPENFEKVPIAYIGKDGKSHYVIVTQKNSQIIEEEVNKREYDKVISDVI